MNRAMSLNRPQSLASDQDMNDGLGKKMEVSRALSAKSCHNNTNNFKYIFPHSHHLLSIFLDISVIK